MEVVVRKRLVKMSKGLKLRALLNERLAVVAEEIFQLFQRTIAEYEEELFGAKDGNERRTQTLEPAMDEFEAARKEGAQILSSCQRKDSLVMQENPVQIYIKEDPIVSIKQEEEEPLPLTVVSVKVDDEENVSSVHHQQTVEKTINIIRKSDIQNDFDFDTSEEIGTPANSLAPQMDEGHSSNACYIIKAPQSIHPQTFYYTNLALPNREEKHVTDSPVTETEKEPKLHKCAQCGKEYHHSSSLFRHIHTHREQKPFRCSVCQKGFSQKPHLTAHMRIHTGEKPFSCPFCARTFSNKSNLSQHLRVHTGEKPFACSICNARFSCLKTLTTHTRIHTGDRPFGCPECGMRFKQQTSLDSHMRTHSGEKPYSCSICERSFSQRRSLKKHLEAHAEQETSGGSDAAVHLLSVQSSKTDETSKTYATMSI